MRKDRIKITDELMIMLNHGKMICYINGIDFETDRYTYIRDNNKIGDYISIEDNKIDSLIISCYKASIFLKKKKRKINNKRNKQIIVNHRDFLDELDETIFKAIETPIIDFY